MEGSFPNSVCKFDLTLVDGFRFQDIYLDAEVIYFSIGCWGSMMSKKKGLLSVRQKRWVVREESRMLGIFYSRDVSKMNY
ncbi:unnamed protein product [Heterosigma akashiwo]|mmetsp:Transcript_25385/g.40104  ORF Transcript_25385/g.40104 Transcript_25385/m.40104 type:complete len:80 (+) Transcript_25385:454-693(+)